MQLDLVLSNSHSRKQTLTDKDQAARLFHRQITTILLTSSGLYCCIESVLLRAHENMQVDYRQPLVTNRMFHHQMIRILAASKNANRPAAATTSSNNNTISRHGNRLERRNLNYHTLAAWSYPSHLRVLSNMEWRQDTPSLTSLFATASLPFRRRRLAQILRQTHRSFLLHSSMWVSCHNQTIPDDD